MSSQSYLPEPSASSELTEANLTAASDGSGVTVVSADFGDVMLQFDPALMAKLGWQHGDTVNIEASAGAVHLENVSANERKAVEGSSLSSQAQPAPSVAAIEEQPLFIVETTITHHIRYAIRAKSLEHAKEAIVMGEAQEFNQNCLGEQIVCGREVSEEEYFGEIPYAWTPEQKRAVVTVIDYSAERHQPHVVR